jgi:hypothetical protein
LLLPTVRRWPCCATFNPPLWSFIMPVLDAVFVGKIYLPELGGGPIYPPPGGGGSPPGIWGPLPGFPTHPIAPGGPPPGIWGPPGPWPTPPIAPGGPPPHPEHPIPPTVWPNPPALPPLGIWGPTDPRPTPPIFIPMPPAGGAPIEPGTIVEWHTAWSPQTGWVVIGTPNVPAPAPA